MRRCPARYKVYIIDEVHMLTTEAFNALLKTLEEPPSHVLFILCTTEPHKVPDTVRSRVQRFDFGRVPSAADRCPSALDRRRRGGGAGPAAARLIARAAQGSVRDGLSLLDQCFATGDRPVTLETCRRALGLAHPEVVRDLLEGLAGKDAAGALRAAGAAFDAGADPRQLLRECSRLARAAELVAVGFAEGVRLEADEEELCRRLAAQEPDGFWLRVLEEMGTAELRAAPAGRRAAPGRGVPAERSAGAPPVAATSASTGSRPLATGGALGQGVEELERREPGSAAASAAAAPIGSGGPGWPPSHPGRSPTAQRAGRRGRPPWPIRRRGCPARRGMATGGSRAAAGSAVSRRARSWRASRAAVGPPGVVAADPRGTGASRWPLTGPGPGSLVTLEAWQAAWPALIEAVNRRDRVFAGVLRGCRPLDAGPDRLVVGAPYDFHLKQLGNPAKRPILASAVEAVAGGPRELAVEFCGTPATPAGGGVADAGAKLTDAVVATFAGSRVTSTRLVDHAHDPVDEG